MNNPPILILQMQRMGDLVLSFPLLDMLRKLFPHHPLWVAGEKKFFDPLRPIAPEAYYFSYEDASAIKGQHFHAVINLSHRREAAEFARQVRSDTIIGPCIDDNGNLFIHGEWQLYRASLTHNNRFNLYHWADLNCLDIIPPVGIKAHSWNPSRTFLSPDFMKKIKIGLFVGASEASKHPDEDFWTELADSLLLAGLSPVLLGGPSEMDLCKAVAIRLNAPDMNHCGEYSVFTLARFIRDLALFITPDTGPMHIAAQMGTPVLNLSLGPVNAWETGPAQPGHLVAKPKLGCAGCWQCMRQKQFCRERITPESISNVVRRLFAGGNARWTIPPQEDGITLLRTGRDKHGLYCLTPEKNHEHTDVKPSGRHLLSRFWQVWFGRGFGVHSGQEVKFAWQALAAAHPAVSRTVKIGSANLAAKLARTYRNNPARMASDPDFWKNSPPPLRPLSGYLQMYVQNASGSAGAFKRALGMAESLAEI